MVVVIEEVMVVVVVEVVVTVVVVATVGVKLAIDVISLNYILIIRIL